MKHLLLYIFALFVLAFGCTEYRQEQAFKQERDTLTSLNEIFETRDTNMLVQALRVIPGQSWSLWSPTSDSAFNLLSQNYSAGQERILSWDSLRYQFINDSTVRAFALDNDTVYQTLTYSNDTLRISDGNYVVIPSSVTDSAYILTQISDSIDVRHYQLTPRDFGAAADNITDDAAAFQAMFDYAEDNSKYFIDLEGLSYYVASSLILPDSFPGTNNRLIIEGNGASIRTDQDINIFQRRPATAGYDNTLIDDSYITIRKTRFDGDDGGAVGLWLAATYNAVIEDCQFTQLDTGVFMPFALNAHIHRNRFLLNNVRDFVGASGSVYGATASASAFNGNTIERNRHFGKAGMETMIHIESADGNSIRNNITEGGTPKIEIYVSTELSVTTNNSIESHWSETTAGSNVIIKWDQGFGFQLTIKNLIKTTTDTVLMVNGSSSGLVKFIDCTLSGTNIFSNRNNGTPNSEGCNWKFIDLNPTTYPAVFQDITSSSNWEGGKVPEGILIERFRSQNTGQHFTYSNLEYRFGSLNSSVVLTNKDGGTHSGNVSIFSHNDILFRPDNDVVIENSSGTDIFTFSTNDQTATFASSLSITEEMSVTDSVIINGLSIYSGTTAPTAGIGSQGSLYMRDDNDSTLYTKTASGWVLIN